MINRVIEWWRTRRAIKSSQKDVLKAVAAVVTRKEEASPMAVANARFILDGVAAGRAICRHCLNPFEYKPRSFPEVVQLRAVLMIPDSVPEPLMVCKTCEDTAVGAYNRDATNVGTRNDGHPNLLLRRFG